MPIDDGVKESGEARRRKLIHEITWRLRELVPDKDHDEVGALLASYDEPMALRTMLMAAAVLRTEDEARIRLREDMLKHIRSLVDGTTMSAVQIEVSISNYLERAGF